MNGVELLKTYKRMCNNLNCKDCGLSALCSHHESCIQVLMNQPENSVAVIEKWAKEHLLKTRQNKFLKIFPNTKLRNGAIQICPHEIGEIIDCPAGLCEECCKDYWLTEVEE